MHKFLSVSEKITYRVEKHFRSEEPLVGDIDIDRLSAIAGLVDQLLELVIQVPLSVLALLLLIKLLILFDDILADVAIFFLDSASDFLYIFRWNRLLALLQLVHDEFGDVAASERDVLDAATNDEAGRYREDVRHTVTGIDDETG